MFQAFSRPCARPQGACSNESVAQAESVGGSQSKTYLIPSQDTATPGGLQHYLHPRPASELNDPHLGYCSRNAGTACFLAPRKKGHWLICHGLARVKRAMPKTDSSDPKDHLSPRLEDSASLQLRTWWPTGLEPRQRQLRCRIPYDMEHMATPQKVSAVKEPVGQSQHLSQSLPLHWGGSSLADVTCLRRKSSKFSEQKCPRPKHSIHSFICQLCQPCLDLVNAPPFRESNMSRAVRRTRAASYFHQQWGGGSNL